MIDAFIDTLETIPRGLVFVGLGLIILVIAKVARDIITPTESTMKSLAGSGKRGSL